MLARGAEQRWRASWARPDSALARGPGRNRGALSVNSFPGPNIWEAILAPQDHPGRPWEQQDGFEIVNNRIWVDFRMIFGTCLC